jgi:hypothetical protein
VILQNNLFISRSLNFHSIDLFLFQHYNTKINKFELIVFKFNSSIAITYNSNGDQTKNY